MKRASPALFLLSAATAAGAAGPVALGQYGRWAAFRVEGPVRCYAIAAAGRSGRGSRGDRAYVTVSAWPARRLFGQVHVRFHRPAREASLDVGGRRFPLVVRGADGWPRDAADGRRIVAAMRLGDRLRVQSRAADGRRASDVYPLAGAASAIDAAGVGCLVR